MVPVNAELNIVILRAHPVDEISAKLIIKITFLDLQYKEETAFFFIQVFAGSMLRSHCFDGCWEVELKTDKICKGLCNRKILIILWNSQ